MAPSPVFVVAFDLGFNIPKLDTSKLSGHKARFLNGDTTAVINLFYYVIRMSCVTVFNITSEDQQRILRMSGSNFYSTIKNTNFSKKILSFKQKRLANVGDPLGNCALLSMIWIRGKITVAKGLNTPELNPFYHVPQDRDANDSNVADAVNQSPINTYNMPTSRNNEELRSNYVQMENAINLRGWQWRPSIQQLYFSRSVMGSMFADNIASLMMSIPQNCLAFIPFRVITDLSANSHPGHAVGAYKTNSGYLHFFDPNAGEYFVHDVNAFAAEWQRCALRSWNAQQLAIDTDSLDLLRIYYV